MGVGGDCLKYLKRGWKKKEGRGNKDFKRGDKLGQRVGALKRGAGGAGTPFRTMNQLNWLLEFSYITELNGMRMD